MAEASLNITSLRGTHQTPLSVLNFALGLLGEGEVSDFNPDPDWSTALLPSTAAGRKVALFWYDAIDDVQQHYFWQELVNVETLTSATADAYGRYPHSLAVTGLQDMIRPMGVMAKSVAGSAISYSDSQRLRNARDSNIAYSISGDTLYSRADIIELSFIKREVDPANWSSELARSIAFNLSTLAARSVTSDETIIRELLERYEIVVKPSQVALQASFGVNDINSSQDIGFIQVQQARQQPSAQDQ